jgi:hypothetical protein
LIRSPFFVGAGNSFGREVNMAAIEWTWFAFVAVAAVFAGSLWATIIVDLFKDRRRSAVGASSSAPATRQPLLRLDGRELNRSHRWTLPTKTSKDTSRAAGARSSAADRELASHEIRRSAPPGCLDRRRPDGPSSVPSRRSGYFTRCHSTPCNSPRRGSRTSRV